MVDKYLFSNIIKFLFLLKREVKMLAKRSLQLFGFFFKILPTLCFVCCAQTRVAFLAKLCYIELTCTWFIKMEFVFWNHIINEKLRKAKISTFFYQHSVLCWNIFKIFTTHTYMMIVWIQFLEERITALVMLNILVQNANHLRIILNSRKESLNVNNENWQATVRLQIKSEIRRICESWRTDLETIEEGRLWIYTYYTNLQNVIIRHSLSVILIKRTVHAQFDYWFYLYSSGNQKQKEPRSCDD